MRQEGGLGWGTHVNPWLIHVNVWQKPLQYCKVISLQLIKINGKKKKKEQYCIGTWNVRSMNQDKLEVVKKEMARVNIDILGISELKWTGMGQFNSDDHHIYNSGKEYLRRNGVAIIVNKRVQNAVPGAVSKTIE